MSRAQVAAALACAVASRVARHVNGSGGLCVRFAAEQANTVVFFRGASLIISWIDYNHPLAGPEELVD
jgi:putative heme iron utilization protein